MMVASILEVSVLVVFGLVAAYLIGRAVAAGLVDGFRYIENRRSKDGTRRRNQKKG